MRVEFMSFHACRKGTFNLPLCTVFHYGYPPREDKTHLGPHDIRQENMGAGVRLMCFTANPRPLLYCNNHSSFEAKQTERRRANRLLQIDRFRGDPRTKGYNSGQFLF
ncbi:unnamed protein product, partial [Vitis vinifera]